MPRPRSSDTRTTTQRGLGATHQREKARLMRLLHANGPRPCRRCGTLMHHHTRCPHGPCPLCTLDLGHPDHAPRVFGGNGVGSDLEHRRCNRQAGARLGNRLRARKRAPVTSRQW